MFVEEANYSSYNVLPRVVWKNSYYYTSIGSTCIVYVYIIDTSTDRNAIL